MVAFGKSCSHHGPMNCLSLTHFLSATLCFGLAACGEEGAQDPLELVDSPPGQPATNSQGEGQESSSPVSPGFRGNLGFEPGGSVGDDALGEFHVVLSVDINDKPVGDLVIDLWHGAAPVTSRNFLRLVDEGFYDGLKFHRILRDFMIQGGCPLSNGTGNSAHGQIVAEFSDDPERDHRYGVISMARMGSDPDSASCQFFICCDDGPKLWNLDGKYSSFGRVVSGVHTLEAIASVAVVNGRGEVSTPNVPITIREAQVVRGPALAGSQPLVRPGKDPEAQYKSPRVIVESLLVACNHAGQPRTVDSGEALVNSYHAQVQAGADLIQLAVQHSDARGVDQDSRRAIHRVLAPNVRDREGDAAVRELQQRLEQELTGAAKRLQAQEITREEYVTISKGLNLELTEHMFSERWRPAREFPAGFLEIALDLDVGELGIVSYHAALAPRGFTLLRRIE